MLRYFKINKDLKLITNIYINSNNNIYNSSISSNNNNRNIQIRTFANKNKNDIILDGKIEYVSREESSTESIKMLLDQLNNKKSTSTSTSTLKKKSLANKDEIIEEEYDDQDDEGDEDFDDRIEIYDENDEEILDYYDDNEVLEKEKRLEQYESDENRMEGMEDYVFDDDIDGDIDSNKNKNKNKNNNSSSISSSSNNNSGSNNYNINNNNNDDYINVNNSNNNNNNNNNDNSTRVLTKNEKKEAKKRMEEKIKKQYGDKADKILHNIQMKHKYGKWEPKSKISRKDMDHLRQLHNENKEYYTIPVLAENFSISEGAVSRILKSKWRPDEEKLAKLQKKKIEENKEKYSPYSKSNKELNLSSQSKVGLNNSKRNNKSSTSSPKILPSSKIDKIDINNWYHQAKNYNKFRIEETKRKNNNNNNNHHYNNHNSNNNNSFKIEKKEIDLNSKFEKIKQIEKLLK